MSDAALYGRLEVRVTDAEKQLARFKSSLDRNMSGLEARTKGAADNMSRSMARAVSAMNQNLEGVGRGSNALSGQVGNLTAQLNDIGTQLAGGQSPFLIAIQQGSQISQVLGQAGAGGAVKALGGAFASLVSPVNLVTLGVIAAGGALVQYVFSGSKDVKTLDEGLKAHADLIGRIKDKYGEAAQGLDNYVKESAAVLKVQAEAGIKAATDTLKEESKTLAKSVGDVFNEVGVGDFGGARAFRASETYRVLTEAVRDLTAAGQTGEPVIGSVRDRITELAAANPANEAIQTLAQKLIGASDGGFKAEQALSKAKAVINTLGSVASGQVSGIEQLNSALRELTQIAVPALSDLEKATESYQKALRNASSREERDDAYAAFQAAQQRIANQQAGASVPIPTRAPSPLGEEPPKPARAARRRGESSFPAGDAVSGFVNDVVYRESGGNRYARNPSSSATGLGQFIESTWLRLFKQNFPDQAKGMSDSAILMLRTDAAISRNLIEKYAEENASVLRQAGVSVNQAALQLSHFLGAGDAVKVLSAAPGTPLRGLISSSSIAANPSILGGNRTVDDAIAYANSRVSGAGSFIASKDEAKAFKAELKEINSEALQMQNTVQGAVRGLVDDLIAGKSAGEAFANVLKKIADRLLDSAFDGLFSNIFGGGGKISGGVASAILGGAGGLFASGGYTGPGGKYEPAGIVHKGEYVMSARAVDRIGVGNLERLHRGYANGGLVGGPAMPLTLSPPDPGKFARKSTTSTLNVNVSGARGNLEIEDAARRGAEQAIAQSRKDLLSYDKNLYKTIGHKQRQWSYRNG